MAPSNDTVISVHKEAPNDIHLVYISQHIVNKTALDYLKFALPLTMRAVLLSEEKRKFSLFWIFAFMKLAFFRYCRRFWCIVPCIR